MDVKKQNSTFFLVDSNNVSLNRNKAQEKIMCKQLCFFFKKWRAPRSLSKVLLKTLHTDVHIYEQNFY